MQEVKLQANLSPLPQKWLPVEVRFLLKYYPRYKAGSFKYSTSFIRGNLKGRTLAAISKKYWTIMGSEKKPKYDPNQFKFDFLQEKITNV